MLTRGSLVAIGDLVKFGKAFQVLPFQWNFRYDKLQVSGAGQRVAFALIMVYMYAEAAYQAYAVYYGYGNSSIPLGKYMKLLEHFVSRCSGLIGGTIMLYKCPSIATFMNQFILLNQLFKGFYKATKHPDTCRKHFRFWLKFVYIHPIVVAFTYVADNGDRRYWHGAAIPGHIRPYFVPLFFIVEYWIGLLAEVTSLLSAVIVAGYFRVMPTWVNTLLDKDSQVLIRLKGKRTITLYHGLQLLTELFNDAFSVLFAFCMGALLFDLTLTTTCTIRLTPITPFPNVLVSPTGVIVFSFMAQLIIAPSANLTEASRKFITAWPRRQTKLEAKIVRSLRPLQTHCVHFFTLENSSVAEFYRIVIDNTVSLLLL